jgi:phospholipase C
VATATPTLSRCPRAIACSISPVAPGKVLPFHPDTKDLGLAFLQDLNHGWDNGHDVLNHGLYDRWVPNKTAATMAEA